MLLADGEAGSRETERQPGSRRKAIIFTALKSVISSVLIWWILRGTDFHEILTAARSANGWLLILVFSLHFIGYYVSVLRWRLLLKVQGVEAKVIYLLKSYIVAAFFNQFLLSTIGGDTIRAYDSYRVSKSKAGGVAVVFIDRFLGLFTLMLFAFISPLFINFLGADLSIIYAWVILGFVIMLVFIWIIFFPPQEVSGFIARMRIPFSGKLEKTLKKLVDAFATFKGRKMVLAKALGLSVILQTNVVFYYYLLSTALNFPIEFPNFFLIVPLSIFIMMLPVTINGIGLRENTFFFFFSMFGVAKSAAIAFAWIEYGMLLIQGIIGGIVYTFFRK